MYSSIASISFAFSRNQTTRACRPSIETVSPTLNLGILRRSTLHSPGRAGGLYLSFLDEDGLIPQPFSVKDTDGFLHSSVVFEFDVAEGWRNSSDEITDN